MDGAFHLDDHCLLLSRSAHLALPLQALLAVGDTGIAAPVGGLSAVKDQAPPQIRRPDLLGLALQSLVGLAGRTGLRSTSNRHCRVNVEPFTPVIIAREVADPTISESSASSR